MKPRQQIYAFDNFQLDIANRQLLRDGSPVPLPAKAFDMLLVLIENGGRLVGKDDLFSRVWPDQIVEESNLTVQVSAIRKALGERKENPHYIVTVPGHGYRFIGDVVTVSDEQEEVLIERHSISRLSFETESGVMTDGNAGQVFEASKTLGPASQKEAVARLSDRAKERVEAELNNHRGVQKHGRLEPWRFRQARPKTLVAICAIILLLPIAFYFGLDKLGGDSLKRTGNAGAGNSERRAFAQAVITKLAPTFNVRDATLSPDGQYVLYLRSDDGIKSIWLGQTNASHSLQISQSIDAEVYGLTFSPDGHSLYYILSGADYPGQTLCRMPITGGVPRHILTSISSPITFSPDGRHLAFTRYQRMEEAYELVVANAENGTEQRVVAKREGQDSFSIGGPAWSPDGQTIALGERNSAGGPYMHVVGVSVETGASKALSEKAWSEVGHIVWLADGAGLAFIARETNSAWTGQLWFLSLADREVRAITNDVVPYASDRLSLSSDGSALLAIQLQNNYQLYVAPDGDASRAHKIDMGATGQQHPLFDPAWTDNGQLVYAVVSGESRTLWLMDEYGAQRRQITPEGEIVQYPSVPGGGQYIIYQATRAGRTDIWRVNLDGSNPQQLTNDGTSYHPHCSPDGTWVAYVSKQTGEERIWRVATDGGEAQRLTDKPSNWPRISPDGNWIACSSVNEESTTRSRLVVIPARGGPPIKTFDLTKTGTFNSGVRWSPNGESIIFRDYRFGAWRQPLSGGPPQPLNSFAKLKIYEHDLSPDGKRMVYTSGAQVRVVTLISNFR